MLFYPNRICVNQIYKLRYKEKENKKKSHVIWKLGMRATIINYLKELTLMILLNQSIRSFWVKAVKSKSRLHNKIKVFQYLCLLIIYLSLFNLNPYSTNIIFRLQGGLAGKPHSTLPDVKPNSCVTC